MRFLRKNQKKGILLLLVMLATMLLGSTSVFADTQTDKKATTSTVWVTLGYYLHAEKLDSDNPSLPSTHSYDILYEDWIKNYSDYPAASKKWRDKLAYYNQKSNMKLKNGMTTTGHIVDIKIEGIDV